MATGLIDTSTLVDLLRGYRPAVEWIKTQAQPTVTRVVHMEVIAGRRDSLAQQKAVRLLRDFEVIPTTDEDLEWATEQLLRLRLSHGIGILDCVIAAPGYRLGLPLFTQNLKHFAPLLGALAQKSY